MGNEVYNMVTKDIKSSQRMIEVKSGQDYRSVRKRGKSVLDGKWILKIFFENNIINYIFVIIKVKTTKKGIEIRKKGNGEDD